LPPLFEQLAAAQTPGGLISLRRRWEPAKGIHVHEVKLGDEYLMSSLFTLAEEELARLGLAAVDDPGPLDVVVGGLGLGCTAVTALDDERVGELVVVDALDEVLTWHRDGLLPDSDRLVGDPRTRLVLGDFFAMTDGDGFDPDVSGRRWHAVLLDVDHSPRHTLRPEHATFYEPAGLARLAQRLHPGGVFALWSDDPPDEPFLAVLRDVFPGAVAHVVAFPNFYTGGESTNTVYVGVLPG
jgi:spermidine synthase